MPKFLRPTRYLGTTAGTAYHQAVTTFESATARDLAVIGQGQPAPLGPFLQLGLGILGRSRVGLEPGPPDRLHETARRLEAAVQVERADHGLASIGEQRRIIGLAGLSFRPGQGQVPRNRPRVRLSAPWPARIPRR